MRSIFRIFVVVGAVMALLTMAAGLSVADNDPLIGKKYSDASAEVSRWNGTAQIETVFGSRLATDDCVVASWRKQSSLDDRGHRQTNIVLLNLNCNDQLASAGSPGNSITSAGGQAQEKIVKTGEWCSQPEQADYADCAKFCTEQYPGMCTADF
jgi:hypothetical protein